MKLNDIISIVEKIAPPRFAASWDNCGIQVACLQQNIECIALCLDPMPSSLQKAIDLGASCIFSHHPLLMQGRLPDKVDNYHHVLRILLQNDVALYAAHTSLDVNTDGPAGWLARALSLQCLKVLETVGVSDDDQELPHEFGYGLVGNVPHEITYDVLLEQLAQHIDLSTATLCGAKPKHIQRIAYCTGSGSSFMHKAHALGADIFITGDVKYHNALDTPLPMLDVGHHSLEEEMMRHLAALLVKLLPSVRVEFIASQSPLRPAQ